jgi:transposase InsO family protein
LKIGRDYLFKLLAKYDLLVKRKLRFTRTTDSGRKPVTYPNILIEKEISRVNEAWVVDITYLNTCSGFVYLYLITDRYSRKIISHVVADSLKAKHACSALLKAISTVNNPEGIIHHSDHGSQYCSEEYQKILAAHNMICSMTGAAHCYDNAVAERVNGILKQEFGLSKVMPSMKVAQQLASDSIKIYNSKRLHKALLYKTPDAVYYVA